MSKRVEITTDDGTLLEADLYGSGARGLVLVHGKVFDKGSWAEQAAAFAEAGLRVMVPNLRGYGGSGGAQDPAGYPQDVAAAVAALRADGAENVSVLGASMGAVAAGKAVSGSLIEGLAALILLSPRAMPAPEALTAGHIAFIASAEEECFADVRAFHDAAPDPKSFHAIPGDAHAQFIFKTSQGAALMNLLSRLLAAPATA